MKAMVILEALVIISAILGTAAVAIDREISPQRLITLSGDIYEAVARETGENVEETVDIVLNTITHQTVTPVLTAQTARSVVRGISELVCEVYEDARYNSTISQFIDKRLQFDGHFRMWMSATVYTSVIIDISEMNVVVDSVSKHIEITVPAARFGVPRVVDFRASVTEAEHLSDEESTGLVAGTFSQHLQNARAEAFENAAGSTILEEVQTDFTVKVAEMLTDIYPDVSVTVLFVSETDDAHDFHDQIVNKR